ncbi:acyl-CoA synthetase [Nocardioides zeae]|uniref:Long-chain acyl-CoA synthetase n=1 Tax=Nocardioides zeae TaxID=1457234 RepID=A0AAJ1U9P0_9ACTN|nr:acyl-CoA synthetase [Nocardioides zeae]MDQ1106682.1 long-chain acyl-CoA synthetase [Nocardioides zeae]
MYPGTHAATHPDKPAVIEADTGRRLTYGALDGRSAGLARVLAAHGLRRGDHIAFLSDNAAEVFEIYWAALRSGLYVTGVNHHLTPAEVAHVVDDCGAEVLIVSAAKADLAVAVLDATPGVRVRLAFGGAVPGHDVYEDALAGQSQEPLEHQPRGADMLYSSGTTGRPKGIKPALPDREVHEPGDPLTTVFGPMYGFGPDTVYYSPAPTYHAAPLRFGGIVHALGGTLVTTRRFDAATALADLETYAVTHSQWVPTMFVRMLKLPDEVRRRHDLSSLQVAIHAAAPCPVEVKHRMMAWWGPVLHEYYTSTEGNGITLIDPETWARKPGSVGRAALGVIHVCDDGGRELPPGRIGTIYFERDTVAFTYHRDPEGTRNAQHPLHETWSTTGDMGYVDDDGFLFLTGRKAFVIISGGVNIYPQEIEDCLALHPKVHDVAVIGVPDEDMGERVKAVVQLADGHRPGPELAEELREFTRGRIAGFKVPRSVDFSDSLPRSATGKLMKHVLHARYAAEAAQGPVSPETPPS